MTDDYRDRLIAAVQRSQARQELDEMSDEQLNDIMCDDLGLPRNTVFSDEQVARIAEYWEGQP